MRIDLDRLMEVGKVTMNGLVDRLEASGYIQRAPTRWIGGQRASASPNGASR